MPLLSFVLVLLHSSAKQSTAAVTASRKVVVMAVSTVQLLVLAGERMIHQRHLAIAALEATLVPMSVFVRQILRVAANGRLALFAAICEQRLVAFDTERLLVTENVTVTGQV